MGRQLPVRFRSSRSDAQHRLLSPTVAERGGPRPAPPAVGPHELQRPNLGAANRDCEIQVRVWMAHLDDLDKWSGRHLDLLAWCQVLACHSITGNRVQKSGSALRGHGGDREFGEPPVMKSDRVGEWGPVAFDVLHHPAVPTNRLADLVEVVLDGEIGVVALPAHGASFCASVGPAFPSGPTSTASCENRTVSTAGPVNGRVSNWFSEYPPLRPPLPGNRDADVCIVCARYTGLWTAYYLKRADPSLRIVILEARFAGFGASGRNGGWLSGLVPGDRNRMPELYGRDRVLAWQRALNEAVDEVVDVAVAEGIDAGIVKGGTMQIARNPAQASRLAAEIDEELSWKIDGIAPLTKTEAAERIRLDGVRSDHHTPHRARGTAPPGWRAVWPMPSAGSASTSTRRHRRPPSSRGE